MQNDKNKYVSPFSLRYASQSMQEIFSEDYRYKTWRKLWLALATYQKELGLNITDEQVEQLAKNVENINYDDALKQEKIVRHDVMAHVHAYGLQAPKAAAIIHLGATSCYVVDNGDLIAMRAALELVRLKIAKVVANLAKFAEQYKSLPTLGFTHFQPAQLVTVGKRACLWIHDLLLDIDEIDFVLANLKFLGSKGTTGTQASFLELFEGDEQKVKLLEQKIAESFGFNEVYAVSGQTYSRKVDSRVLNVLAQVAQSASKFSNDLRLLSHLKEMEEPFEAGQIGSSAMAYKRNPMRSERMGGLARFVINMPLNAAHTAANQWFERTLDDSANKRLSVSEAFLATDGLLDIYINITNNPIVYPNIIKKRIEAELPFMATENIMMNLVKKGKNRQEIHEKIRLHSMQAAKEIKEQGQENNLLEKIANDADFGISLEELQAELLPENFIGLSVFQVEQFLEDFVNPFLQKINIDSIKANDLKV